MGSLHSQVPLLPSSYMVPEHCYLYQHVRNRYVKEQLAESVTFFKKPKWIHVVATTTEPIDRVIMSQFIDEVALECGMDSFQVRAIRWLENYYRILSVQNDNTPILKRIGLEYGHTIHDGVYVRNGVAVTPDTPNKDIFPFCTNTFRTLKPQPVTKL